MENFGSVVFWFRSPQNHRYFLWKILARWFFGFSHRKTTDTFMGNFGSVVFWFLSLQNHRYYLVENLGFTIWSKMALFSKFTRVTLTQSVPWTLTYNALWLYLIRFKSMEIYLGRSLRAPKIAPLRHIGSLVCNASTHLTATSPSIVVGIRRTAWNISWTSLYRCIT